MFMTSKHSLSPGACFGILSHKVMSQGVQLLRFSTVVISHTEYIRLHRGALLAEISTIDSLQIHRH